MSKDLQKLKQTWQKHSQALTKPDQLTQEDIMDFISSESRQVAAGSRKSLLFDIFFKTFLTVSFIVLAFLFKADANIVILNLALMIFTALTVFLQTRYYRNAAAGDNRTDNIKEYLRDKIKYFNTEFIKAVYMIALTSPVFFISGVLYYFYFKYGTIRPLDTTDYLVFAGGLIIAFLISALAQITQYKFQLSQLNACYNDLDEKEINQLKQRKSQNKRLLVMTFWSGLFILTIFTVIYIFT